MTVSNGATVTDRLRPVSDEVSGSIGSSVDRPIHAPAVIEQHPGAVTRTVPRGTAATTTAV